MGNYFFITKRFVFLFFLLAVGKAFSDDLISAGYGLPSYSKKELQAALAKIPPQAKKIIEKAVAPGSLEKLEWIEKVLHGSQAILARVTKIRDPDEDAAVGDAYVYFLIEITKGKSFLWKWPNKEQSRFLKWPTNWYPKESFMVPFYGFVEDAAFNDHHLDFYINFDRNNQTAKRYYFRFIPGKGVYLVLACPEVMEEPMRENEVILKKRNIYESNSEIIPEETGRLRVVTQTEEGTLSLDPDPQKAAAQSIKHVTKQTSEYRWAETKQMYELAGTPVTQTSQ